MSSKSPYPLSEREALKIAAAVLHPQVDTRGGSRRRSTHRDVRDVAASACGMVHREGHLLMRVPAAILLRDRVPLPDDSGCLLRGGQPLP